jgi:hypothetical protein
MILINPTSEIQLWWWSSRRRRSLRRKRRRKSSKSSGKFSDNVFSREAGIVVAMRIVVSCNPASSVVVVI